MKYLYVLKNLPLREVFLILYKLLPMRGRLLALLLLFFAPATWAQHGYPKVFQARYAGSVDLSKVDDKYSAQVLHLEMPEIEGDEENERLKETKEESAARFPRRKAGITAKITAAPSPIVARNFVADSNSGIPPDNYMAISRGYKAVSVINQIIAVHDANTGAYLYRKGLATFSSAIGLTGVNNYRFDPKIVYDPDADRFICVLLNGVNQYNYIVMGFSQTNDPAGVWHFYAMYGNYAGDTTWFDYPAIAMTKNEFFLTGNKIKFDSSWQAGFKETLIYQVRKSDGYSGATTLTYQIWDSISYNGRNIRCLHPVNPGDALAGPEQFFLSNRNFDILNDTVFLVRVPDTIGSGATTLNITPVISSISYGVPPDAREVDTNLALATNDGRILGGYIRGDEIQFVSASVYAPYGSSGVYHGVMRNVHSTPTLQGRIFAIDSLDFGYPNISYAGNQGGADQSIISFNYSGPHNFPAFGCIFFDGSSFSNLTTIKRGDTTIGQLAGRLQRWGDYSGSQPEWGAPGVVWTEGIFGRWLRRYGNYMAQIKSPYFTAVKQVEARKEVRVYPNPAMEIMSLDFTLLQSQQITFYICDANGRTVDRLTADWCREGKNQVQLNIALLAPGTYFVRGIGTSEKIMTQKFIKQ
jgi:hypothetical protein